MILVYAVQSMGSRHYRSDSILNGGLAHFHGFLQSPGAVIEPLKDMAMNVNHPLHPFASFFRHLLQGSESSDFLPPGKRGIRAFACAGIGAFGPSGFPVP